jgi:autotransporter-associated beta strand protein
LKLAGAQTLNLGGSLIISTGGVLFNNSSGAATITGAAINALTLTGGGTTNASATVTVASTAGILPGMAVTGTGIPVGATVLSVTNATTFVLSANATATNTAQTFTAATEVIVTTNGTTPANALTISSLISGGAGSLTKAGTGLLVITGANTYTGTTNINQGTVQLAGATAALGSNSNVNLRQATTLDLNAAGASVSVWNTHVAAPRVLIGALAGTGTVVNTNAAPSILSIGNGNGNGTFNGLINQTAGAITLVKNGSGTQSLTALNN